MTPEQYLKTENSSQKKLIKQLVNFYDATQDALAKQKKGHTDGWVKVQKIADKIEDDFDLTMFKE